MWDLSRDTKIEVSILYYYEKYKLTKTMPRLQPGIFMGYGLSQGCVWNGIYYVADVESFRGKFLNQATSARRLTHIVHATKVIRTPDSDSWVFLSKAYIILITVFQT